MATKQLPSIKQRKIVGINGSIAQIRANLEVLDKSGLRKSNEAKRMVQEMNSLVIERDKLDKQDRQERRECVEHLLLCIAAADFACEAGNLLSTKLKKTYGRLLEAQEDLIKLLDGVAKDFGGLVMLIDRACDERFSMNFAAMSDEIMDSMTQANIAQAKEIVARHDNAGNGNNIRFKKKGA